jgi:hypothetical protein
MGADMKWLPRGVGKWSLNGDSQSAMLVDLSRPLRTSMIESRADSPSSSIIVLRDRCRLRACTGAGGLYVVAGRRSNVPILSTQRTP